MPDSLKLLSLQDALVDEIQKRIAYIFNNGYSFEQAYYELSEKYGSSGSVMQAHNSHLLQTQPVRVGDFNAFFLLECRTHVSIHLLHGHLFASVQIPPTTSNWLG